MSLSITAMWGRVNGPGCSLRKDFKFWTDDPGGLGRVGGPKCQLCLESAMPSSVLNVFSNGQEIRSHLWFMFGKASEKTLFFTWTYQVIWPRISACLKSSEKNLQWNMKFGNGLFFLKYVYIVLIPAFHFIVFYFLNFLSYSKRRFQTYM